MFLDERVSTCPVIKNVRACDQLNGEDGRSPSRPSHAVRKLTALDDLITSADIQDLSPSRLKISHEPVATVSDKERSPRRNDRGGFSYLPDPPHLLRACLPRFIHAGNFNGELHVFGGDT